MADMIKTYRLLLLFALLTLWWLISLSVGANLVPSPIATWQAATRLFAEGRLVEAIWDSLSIYVSGYLLAVAVAIPLGVLMGTLVPLGKTLEIYVYALSATPRVAFIPLIIVPSVFLSGLLINTDQLPGWAQVIGRGLPLYYANIVIQEMIRPNGTFGAVRGHFVVLLGYSAVLLLLASRTLAETE